MDPLSHVIVARTLLAAVSRSSGSRVDAGAGAAAVLGALAPDFDCVLMPRWDVYLRWHEVATHSLAGGLCTGVASAMVVRLFVRGSRLSSLVVAGCLGAVSHLVLDSGAGARLGLAWPLSERRFPLPLVAMADPWLMLILAVGALWVWVSGTRRRRHACAVLLTVALFAGVKGVAYARVRGIVADQGHVPLSERMFEARWASLHEWLVHERDAAALRTWQVDAWNRQIRLMLDQPVPAETALVTASRSLPTIVNLLRVHDYAFALEPIREGNLSVVRWSDIRFCWTTPAATQCALWFGGTFDANARPVQQIMQVGNWLQTRPPAE